MLYLAAFLLFVAILAAVFGFGGLVAGAVGTARLLFVIFVVLFIASLFAGALQQS